jgi:hypothetical protein
VKEWRLSGVTAGSASPRLDAFVPHDPARALVDQLPATLWTTDRALRFTSFLGRGVAGLGLGPNQVVGTAMSRLFETSDAAMDAVAAHRRALRGETVPLWLTWASQSLHALVGPLRDGSTEIIGTIGIAIPLRGNSSKADRHAEWSA